MRSLVLFCCIFVSIYSLKAFQVTYNGKIYVEENGAIAPGVAGENFEKVFDDLGWDNATQALFFARWGTNNKAGAKKHRISFLKDHSHLKGVTGTVPDGETVIYKTRAVKKLWSYGQKTCLSPSMLYSSLLKKFAHHSGYKLSNEKHSYGGIQTSSFFMVDDGLKGKLLIHFPAHDLDAREGGVKQQMQQQLNGDMPLEKALSNIHTFIQDNKDINVRGALIPIAEARNNRNHWVLIYINFDKPRRAYFIDSKAVKSLLYDINYIKHLVHKKFHMVMDLYYFGHQGLINSTDCGYFVRRYIEEIIGGMTIPNLGKKEDINLEFPLSSKKH